MESFELGVFLGALLLTVVPERYGFAVTTFLKTKTSC